jgi:tRNA(Ile)-lysidine synthase TilS/MesJ
MSGARSRCCRRCLLPEAVPGLVLDSTDLCHICQATPPAGELARLREGIRLEMEAVLETHRGARPYECVVAFSGGKDSSYTLKLLVEHYKLRCLAVTIDNSFLSNGTLANCRAVCGGLGVDHVLFTPNRAFIRQMYGTSAVSEEVHAPSAIQRASSICNSCINLINTHILQKALELGAPLVAGGYLAGQLPKDASLMTLRPGVLVKVRTPMVNRFVKFFGEEARPYFELPRAQAEPGREIVVINPMLGLSVREEEIITSLQPLGWKRPHDTGVTSTNCRLNDLGVYIHSRRHGFHPYAFEIADQLRHGLVTLEEAAAKLDAIPSSESVAWLAQGIGVKLDAF